VSTLRKGGNRRSSGTERPCVDDKDARRKYIPLLAWGFNSATVATNELLSSVNHIRSLNYLKSRIETCHTQCFLQVVPV
jgi:hypothetical protein